MKSIKLFFLLVLIGCFGCSYKPPKHDKLLIVTTTGMLADAIHNIVQDSANVMEIMGPGVDPHLYKASQGDLKKFLDADIIFYGGLHLEGKLTEVLKKLGRTKPVIGIGDELPSDIIRVDSSFANAIDPHIWFDVGIWREAVNLMALHLIELDVKNASYYRQNADIYMKKLAILDGEVRQMISTIPESKRVMITAHDAFNYFGRAYGIEVKGLQGISTSAEFGLRDVSSLVDLIQKRHISAVFVETSVSDRAIKAVVAGVRERGGTLMIGGNLYSDAMGASNTPEGTYIGMVKHNVKTIVKALK